MRHTMRRPYPAYRINAYQPSTDAPMSQMNTTPLIDVLLVLLIMLIMTIPMSTHVVDVDLPNPHDETVTDAERHAITITAAGQVLWDGQAVDRDGLQERLDAAAQLPATPIIHFQPDPQASYDSAVQVIAQVGDAGIDKFAFIGNEQFRSFGSD